MTGLRLIGVTVSSKPETWEMDIPLYCHVGPRRDFDRKNQQKHPARVEFLAGQREQAMEGALERFPETSHVLNIESYYLNQTMAIRELITAYQSENIYNSILGAGIWCYARLKLFGNRKLGWYYDIWATPELAGTVWKYRPMAPFRVQSVGSVFIMPVTAWLTNHFHNQGFPERFYYNNLCKDIPTIIDPNIMFWRTSRDSDIEDPSWRARLGNEILFQLMRVRYRGGPKPARTSSSASASASRPDTRPIV